MAHRHNSTTFYFAFEGEGAVVIEGERLEYHPGDIFAVPAWTWHHHENTGDNDSILFSIDDWPAMKKLGFYMKEEAKGF
jgi:gentisate 1,2-dioxygenase